MNTPHDHSPAVAPSPDDPAVAGPRHRPTSRWAVVIPAVALLVGLLLGGAVVGVAMSGDDRADPDQSKETGVATEDVGDDEPATAVIVPDSCLQAAESVEEATRLVRDGIDAVRELRADDMIQLLNELEDLDNLTRQQAQTCTGTTVTDAPLETEPTS